MGGKLTVVNDLNTEIIDAYIFTAGQGFCLEKLSCPFNIDKSKFFFSKGLGYGSWYDVLVRINRSGSVQAYMSKGIYLSVNKCIELSKVLNDDNRVNCDDGEWKCKNCKEWNESNINICMHCYTNRARGVIRGLSFIPVLGVPFSFTHAVLETGRACHTGQTHDKFDAGIAIGAAILDVILTPLFVSSFIKIPAAAAAKTGAELTSKALLSETGKIAGKMAVKKVTTAVGSKLAGVGVGEIIADATRPEEKKKQT